jgi:Zn-dependent protease with chaperone function
MDLLRVAEGREGASSDVAQVVERTRRELQEETRRQLDERRRYMRAAPYADPEDAAARQWLLCRTFFMDLARKVYKKSVEPSFKFRTGGNAVQVSESQLPELWAVHLTCANRLGLSPPALYVENSPEVNAFTAGLDQPAVILTSSLVDCMSESELAFIIGHEMGHVACQHVLLKCTADELITTLEQALRKSESEAGQLSNAALYGAGAGGAGLIFMAFAGMGAMKKLQSAKEQRAQWEEALGVLKAWGTKSEVSADRAGLLCCRDSGTAVRCMVKLAIGSRALAERVDVEAYLAQGDGVPEDVQGGTHPATVHRARMLRKWHGTWEYGSLLRVSDYLLEMS